MRRDERGGAMIAVVLISMVASLLAIAALASVSGSLRSSAKSRAVERAVNLAEAAASRALSLVAAAPTYANTAALGSSPGEDEILTVAATLPIEPAPDGEMTWVVPVGGGVAYGVAYVPTRADATASPPRGTVHVATVRFAAQESAVTFAVLTAGDLAIGGGATITGLGGSVHANGDLVIGGSANVSGDASASGTATKGGAGAVGGDTTSGAPRQALPAVDPGSYRDLTTYDLCPDATVRAHAAVVCAGAIVGDGLATELVGLVPTLVGWNGWTYSVVTGWTMSSSSPLDGGFYVHAASARVTGNPGSSSDPWLATIVVGGTSAGAVLSSGDLTIAGNGVVRPWRDGVLAVAERDLAIGGSAYALEGLAMAGEHAALTGGGTLTGQLVAAGTADTTGSPVGTNAIDDARLEAEFGAPISVGGVAVERWADL